MLLKTDSSLDREFIDLMNVWCINEEFTVTSDQNSIRLHSELRLELLVTLATASDEFQKKLELA